MYVYKLESYNKNRVKIYLDEDRPAFVLYKKEAEKYAIKEGGELSALTYEEILNEILIKRACSRTLYLLDASGKTESQIRKKLSEAFYPEEAVDAAIEYAKSRHYIDDEYYALNFAEARTMKKSRKMVEKELLQRGIDRDIIDNALSQVERDEKETIREHIKKKYPASSSIDAKDASKLFRSLLSKGFKYDDIRTVFDSLNIDITYKSD